MTAKEYPFPVFGTQGGGLARQIGRTGQTFIFVEAPDCPGLDVGDTVPQEWGLAPANQPALALALALDAEWDDEDIYP
jgi:hypothetical protein